MKKRLGELLLERRLIDVDQLNAALAHQRQWGMRLGTALVAKGFITESNLVRVLAESLHIPVVDLARVQPDAAALSIVPARVAEQHEVFPVAVQEQKGRRVLLLAMADPLNVTASDEIAFTADCVVKPAIAPISALERAIQRWYHGAKVEIPPLDVGLVPQATAPQAHVPQAHVPQANVRQATGAPPPEPSQFAEFSDFSLEHSDPGGPVVVGRITTDPYGSLPPGSFGSGPPAPASSLPPEALSAARPSDREAMEALEKKFWALMRVLSRRGLVTKEEFLAELKDSELA